MDCAPGARGARFKIGQRLRVGDTKVFTFEVETEMVSASSHRDPKHEHGRHPFERDAEAYARFKAIPANCDVNDVPSHKRPDVVI